MSTSPVENAHAQVDAEQARAGVHRSDVHIRRLTKILVDKGVITDVEREIVLAGSNE